MTRGREILVGVDSERLCQQLRTETDAKAAEQLILVILYAGFSPYQVEHLLGNPY